MSRVARQKHIMRERWTDDYSLPKENQSIVRIMRSKGNNLHEVESGATDSSEETFLVSMPPKFRRNMWVKRGDYVLVEPIVEGDKVKAEIVQVLTPEHIKEYTKANIWPQKFTKKRSAPSDDEVEDNMDTAYQNPNRRATSEASESSSDSE